MQETNTEIIEQKEPSHASLTSHVSLKMSEAVFDNPREFIKVLQRDFDRIPHSIPNLLSKNDLIIHALNSTGESGKAAAIAVRHLNELRDISGIPTLTSKTGLYGEVLDGVTRRDLKNALDLNDGLTNFYVVKQVASGVLDTAVLGLATVMGGALTFMSTAAPPMAGMWGALTLAMAGTTAQFAYNTYNRRSWLNEAVQHNQQTLASWPEINRYKTRKAS